MALFTLQQDLEQHVAEYNNKLDEFSARSHDLEKTVSCPESQRLLETVSHFQNSFGGIRQGAEAKYSNLVLLTLHIGLIRFVLTRKLICSSL